MSLVSFNRKVITMKKTISLFLVISILFTFAACSADNADNTSTTVNTVTENTSDNTQTQTQEINTDKKILTIYFSSANTSDADLKSSATPYFDSVASTQYLAEYIHNKVGGDIAKITPVNDYPKSYAGTVADAKKETDGDARPEYQPLDVNPEDYDIIFIGYPMWWYTLPMILYTFFDAYDFSGKTIIPFNTHAGSGDGGTYDEIRAFEPGATVLNGLAVSGSKADKADGDIDEWLDGLEY